MLFQLVVALTNASGRALGLVAFLLAVPLGVALFHPDDKRARRAHAILRDLLDALRRRP